MKGIETIPENITWSDAVWSDGPDVKGCWENENVGNILSLIHNRSHSKEYLVSGDDEGIIRLFSYPCEDTTVCLLQVLCAISLLIPCFLVSSVTYA